MFIQNILKGGALAPVMSKANEDSELPHGVLIPVRVGRSEQFELHPNSVAAVLQFCAAHSFLSRSHARAFR